MSNGCRTIGLVFLLFACSGDAAWDLRAETERDYKVFRLNGLCAVENAGNSLPRCDLPARQGPGAASATSLAWPSLGAPVDCRTLLSLGCLLSV
jgi:hypothetical protein